MATMPDMSAESMVTTVVTTMFDESTDFYANISYSKVPTKENGSYDMATILNAVIGSLMTIVTFMGKCLYCITTFKLRYIYIFVHIYY